MTVVPEFLRDYSRWVKFDWTPEQAALLTVGLFPTSVDNAGATEVPAAKEERHEWIITLIRKAIDQSKLANPIKPPDFVVWAGKLKIDLPEKLLEQVDLIYSPKASVLDPRERNTHLNIIGALLELMLGTSSDGKPNTPFRKQSAIIIAILEKYPDRFGLKQRTLEEKFAEANHNLQASK